MNQIDKEAQVRSDASINPTRRRPSQARRVLLALVLGCALLATVGATPALANFSVTSFSNRVINSDSTPDTQAGSHPFEMVTNIGLSQQASGAPTENVKDVAVGLPTGLIGNPNATPRCPVTLLNTDNCPAASQVGDLTITLNVGGGDSPLTSRSTTSCHRPACRRSSAPTFCWSIPTWTSRCEPGLTTG